MMSKGFVDIVCRPRSQHLALGLGAVLLRNGRDARFGESRGEGAGLWRRCCKKFCHCDTQQGIAYAPTREMEVTMHHGLLPEAEFGQLSVARDASYIGLELALMKR